MRQLISAFVLLPFVGALAAACNGTTGDQLITFPAYAAGAKGAGEPFSSNGFTVQLTFAQMYVGAIYVNEAPQQTGSTFDSPACIDTGVYCAQVYDGLEVDLLSPTPQQFPVQGTGSADLGLSWQLYLVDGDVNQPTIMGVPDTADLVGTATREADGAMFSWAATVTINAGNRGMLGSMPGTPGQYPICAQRIINFAGINLQFSQGGTLLLTIDPRAWFPKSSAENPIDFSTLPPCPNNGMTQCPMELGSDYGCAEYCIPDSSNLNTLGQQQGISLFKGIQDSGSAGFNLTYSSP